MRRLILRWYRRSGRDLPWRRTRDPYAILVSEIMLQQTQVERVLPFYERFLARFPTFGALASARLGDVLRTWLGLGYNGRAQRLWACARVVTAQCSGVLPSSVETLRSLPGIGRYTASAIACFALGAREAVVDTNVRRVLSRALDGVDDAGEPRAWELAAQMLPRRGANDWNQALMDVGARFCRPVPKCEACPIRNLCRARAEARPDVRSGRTPSRRRQPRFAGSRRYYRGRVVNALARVPSMSFIDLGKQVKTGFEKSDLPWLGQLLGQLRRDGLVVIDRSRKRARLP